MQKSDQHEQIVKMVTRLKRRNDTYPIVLADRFPDAWEYLRETFPDFDPVDVDIYLAPYKAFKTLHVEFAGGFYIRTQHFILIRIPDHEADMKRRMGKFNKKVIELTKESDSSDEVDPGIVVHECLHAISDLTRRATRHFTGLEEEFVYTNSIGYYRKNGISDEEMIDKILVPFFLNDIIDMNRFVYAQHFGRTSVAMKEMLQIILSLRDKGTRFEPIDTWTPKYVYNVLNRKANVLAPLFVEKSREKARTMIEIYERNSRSSPVLPDEVAPSMPGRAIDLDAEW